MTMIELHVLQSLPANNVNRGEDGDVKTLSFGGSTRQRVSSQAWKRVIRHLIQVECLRDLNPTGILSRVYGDHITDILVKEGLAASEVTKKLKAIGLGFKASAKKEADEPSVTDAEAASKKAEQDKAVMMYLSSEEVNAIIAYVRDTASDKDTVKSLKQIIKDANARIAYDIALLGRMFANHPDLNVYGAIRMAHALSTHSIDMESDYFAAVDQLAPNGGAGHLMNQSITSSTVYRYIGIDLDQLKVNLDAIPDNGTALPLGKVVEMFLRHAYVAVPAGKENSMCAYTRPSYVNIIVRNGFPCSYANAFEKPIEASAEGFIAPSIRALKQFRDEDLAIGFDEIHLNIELGNGMSFNNAMEQLQGVLKAQGF